MKTYQLNGMPTCFCIALLLTQILVVRTALSQDTETLFEAPLMGLVNDQAVRKGTAQGTMRGDTLQLFVAYAGLKPTVNAVVGANLYRGHPASGGVMVQNIAGILGFSGGFENEVKLDQATQDDLHNGRLYISVKTELVDPGEELIGQLMSAPNPGFVQTPLTYMYQGYPTAKGGVRAQLSNEGIRLFGYFNGLTSDWQRISLYRGLPGTEGEYAGSIYHPTGEEYFYAGFDLVMEVQGEGWEEAMAEGQISVVVETSQASAALRGRLQASTNKAPQVSQVLSPADGEIITIGGMDGEAPVDPDETLGEVSLLPVEDPDGNPVEYLWQVSLHPGFGIENLTTTFKLGVDSTRVLLTTSFVAALIDTLSIRQSGSLTLNSPVKVYHRVLTTDGSRYAIGESIETTFIRGAITSYEPDSNLPETFTLHGNYPNPFNPATTITFDLPVEALVRVEIFNMLGQQVLSVQGGKYGAGVMQKVQIDGSSLSSGSYLYRVIADGVRATHIATGKMTFIK